MRSAPKRRGSAMVGALVVSIGLFGLIVATIAISTAEVRDSDRALDELRTRYLAEAGVERGLDFVAEAALKTSIIGPMEGLGQLFVDGDTIVPIVGETFTSNGRPIGAYTVAIERVEQTDTSMTLELRATGYMPDAPTNLAPGQRVESWASMAATVTYELGPSKVFDYAYFINNWGWFYGSSIFCNGNARSNAQFDVAGYQPTITGQPLYESIEWMGSNAVLVGYQDDNGDGLHDGNDGGVFSGWDIVGASNVQGNGGLPSNQHDFQEQIEMPNLSHLGQYEELALAAGSSLSIGGVMVSDGVYGDDPGESGNLYLVGTAAEPIVLDGPVVARGHVIIKGYVTGQGSIYAGGNVYVPDSIRYLDGPSTPRPADNTQPSTEAWLTANAGKDFLGLFAAENVVVGNHTHSAWRSYVSGWMNSPLNESEEDAGEDGLPNTAAGKDGIFGTADDDVLEGDGIWTTELYSAADALLGLIPEGFEVGDPVPGSGEDIDGDGQYDPRTSLADIDLDVALTPEHWGGNMPPSGIANYSSIASLYANRLDGVFYTNHSFCYVVFGSNPAQINGSLVSRNENIVYGTPKLEFNYDSRLIGGSNGIAGGMLPRALQAPEILRWERLDRDPHRYLEVQVQP